MADKLIPKDDEQNYYFCRLQLVVETFLHVTQLNKPTNQNSIGKSLQRKYLIKSVS